MSTYTLCRETLIRASLHEVWTFFSSPHNLGRITPKYMDFRVTHCPDVPEIYTGMEIAYEIRPVLGIPLQWLTLIRDVQAPYTFTDVQLKGPYRSWVHIHTFREELEGVHMSDEITYALPLGMLGQLAHSLFVRRQLEYIFDYRTRVIRDFFKKTA